MVQHHIETENVLFIKLVKQNQIYHKQGSENIFSRISWDVLIYSTITWQNIIVTIRYISTWNTIAYFIWHAPVLTARLASSEPTQASVISL